VFLSAFKAVKEAWFSLTAQPWAERGSWFTRVFLTARPWAEHGSWFTCGFFFVDLCASRPKLPLGQILSHATCDVYSPKAVETLINLIDGKSIP